MEDFTAPLGIREALELYIFLEEREDELSGGPARLYVALRAYLYDHLSIEEMESPQTLLSSLNTR